MANSRLSKKHEDIMREFIELYKDNPCLWKIKSKEYSNKILKEEAYKILVIKLKEINEDAAKEDVIKKINSMRSCFRKEFKKFMDSKKSGTGTEEVYKPTLWYYELLLFLKDQEMPREPVGFDIPRDEISRVSNKILK
jgi:Alcohol dehydrogenase transcription factor Myb/SANT-like